MPLAREIGTNMPKPKDEWEDLVETTDMWEKLYNWLYDFFVPTRSWNFDTNKWEEVPSGFKKLINKACKNRQT